MTKRVKIIPCFIVLLSIFFLTSCGSSNKYSVTFKDYDGRKLKEETVLHGDSATAPTAPSREGYTFNGWDVSFDNVTKELDVTATYQINTYTVTWKNYGGTVLEKDENIDWGTMPTYDGLNPTKPKTNEFNYTFIGWTPEVNVVSGNHEYTAKFEEDTNSYLVTFIDYDGKTLKEETVLHGGSTTAPTPPSREGYIFNGWDVDFGNITSDTVVKARYKANIYIITWKNYDGSILKEEQVEYGQMPIYDGIEPIKLESAGYSYQFSGWSPLVNVVTRDLEYIAEFIELANEYTIIWKNYDGTILEIEDASYGALPTYKGLLPIKPETKEYKYTFSGWSPEITNVNKTVEYVAWFKEVRKTYEVKFLDWDHFELKVEIVEYGSFATAPNVLIREGFSFDGWDSNFNYIQEDLVVYATYKINIYKVIFYDWDGTELKREDVPYSSYATAPSNPEKDNYRFTGWDQTFDYVTADLIVKAQYEKLLPFSYEEINNEITITRYLDSAATEIVIPDKIDDKSVTRIAIYAFYNLEFLKSIVIPDSVKYIESYAFFETSNIESITIPFSGSDRNHNLFSQLYYIFGGWNDRPVNLKEIIITDATTIGTNAFSGISSLTNITINSVVSIEDSAFRGLSSLSSIFIPNSVISIGDYAFSGTNSLKTVVFEEDSKLKVISNYAFSNSTNLTNIEIPYSVTTIGDYAFQNASSLTNLIIPNSVISIGKGAFSGAESLQSITLPFIGSDINYSTSSNLKYIFNNIPTSLSEVIITDSETIGDFAFAYATSLTNIVISNTVISIGNSAFSFTTSLTSIFIPNSIISIGDYIFKGASSLKTVEFEEGIKLKTISNYAFYGTSNLFSINIPNSVERIGDYAFSEATSLTNIFIPNNVNIIGDYIFSGASSLNTVVFEEESKLTAISNYAFSNSTNLTNIEIPNRVTSLGDYAFSNSTNLTKIEIPNSVTSIGDYAFENASSLTNIIIPNSVINIGFASFFGTINLELISLPFVGSDREQKTSSEFKYIFKDVPSRLKEVIITDTKTIGQSAFYNIGSITNIVFPDNLEIIENFAFYNMSGLVSLEIPNNVISIGDAAFYNLVNLTSVFIPSSVISIGDSAFYGANNLKSLEFEEESQLKSIGELAFYHTGNLTSVVIPKNVTRIGEAAFKEANKLEAITLPFVGSDIDLLISSRFDYIFGHLLPDTLKEVTITNAIKIGDYAFHNATNLTSVIISNGVVSIGDFAFYEAKSLTGIEIPDSIIKIGASSFYGTTNLKTISLPFIGSDREHTISSKFNYIFNDVPNSIKEVIITDAIQIEANAFYNNTSLTSITISNNISNINYSAFSGAKSLLNINIDNQYYRSIDGILFDKNALTLIRYPEGRVGEYVVSNNVISIGENAFDGAINLTSIVIPNNVVSIGSKAFNGAISLKSMTLPFIGSDRNHSESSQLIYILGQNTWINEVIITDAKTLGDAAFLGVDGLTNITIPNSVVSIGNYAFQNVRGLTNIVIPTSIISIGKEAFSGAYNLKSITLPFIGSDREHMISSRFDYIFNFVPNSLKEVIITDATQIEAYAFLNTSLTSITILNNLSHIDYSVFNGTSSLLNINISADNEFYQSVDGILFDKSTKELIVFPNGRTGEYIVPSNVENIFENAFYGAGGLTSIIVPNSVLRIGSGAFNGTSSLKSMTLPFIGSDRDHSQSSQLNYIFNGVPRNLKEVIITDARTIGDAAFFSLSDITNIVIPNTVTSIGRQAFVWTYGLKNIVIPNSVNYIGSEAFNGSSSLESMTLPFIGSDRNHSSSSRLNYLFDGFTNSIPTRLKEIIITDATSIGNNAFLNLFNLTNIVIPNTVTSIGNSAFSGTSGLTSLIIPDTVTSIGDSAFKDLSNITNIIIPNNVINIGYGAFSGAIGLTEISIPKKIEFIGESAFSNASSLINITVDNENAHYQSIDGILFNKSGDILIKYPEGRAGEYIITSNVTDLGAWAFMGARNLTKVTIPNSLTNIKTNTFLGASSLTDINVLKDNENLKSIDGVLFNKDVTTLIKYPEGKTGDYIVPTGVIKINESAFSEASKLTSVIVPNSVLSIGSGAFKGTTSLASITLPFVGESRDVTNDVLISTSENKYIFGYIFGSDTWITTLEPIPKVKYGDLTNQGQEEYRSYSSGGYYTYLYRGYYIPDSLKTIIITDAIGVSANAFYNMTEVETIILNDEATFRGDNAFFGTYNLVS